MRANLRIPRLFLMLGVALVLGFAVSMAAFQHSSAAADKEPSDGRAAQGVSKSEGVICLGDVDLEHGITALSVLQPGRVAELLAHENDRVAAGAVLLRLDDAVARLQVAEARVALEKAQSQLSRARKVPDQQRARLEQQRQAIAAAGQRLAAARSLLARKQKLSALQQLGAEELAAAQNEVQQLEAGERAECAKLTEAQLNDPAMDVRQAELDVQLARVRLEQALHALDECSLKAPEAGTVLRLLVGPGDILPRQPNQAAVLFAAHGRRLVRAEVDQEFAGAVKAGQAALVQDDAPSGLTWRGRVLRVADWYTQRRNVVREPYQLQDVRTVECLIALDAGQDLPRLGQRVRVSIETETR
ncbi:MAG TPA: HlyD family efflux transporter periplasmic adaptor subunit [Gemmataceae bacterium]|jgi:multidrug resistance efflux pump|nr:HlyD family efflux transporter periplasmic adaptor subunit [Gemmataceae bacterium]